MDLNNLCFADHDSCQALTSAIATMSGPLKRERTLSFDQGESIWLPIDPPSHVYALDSGRVEITQTSRAGMTTLLQIVRPGEMFGYLCFCSHQGDPQETEARATVPSIVRRTGYEAFRKAVKQDPATAAGLLETLCGRVLESDRRANMLAHHEARKRLATLLLQLAASRSRASPPRSQRVALHISHAEVAALACLTRPHTTVLLNRLRATGHIAYVRGSAIQVDTRKLESLLSE